MEIQKTVTTTTSNGSYASASSSSNDERLTLSSPKETERQIDAEKGITTTTSYTAASSASLIGRNFTGDDEKEAELAEGSQRRGKQGSDENDDCRGESDSAESACEFACCSTGIHTVATDDTEEEPDSEEETKIMEIEMNEDGCYTVKVAVPQVIRGSRKGSPNRWQSMDAGAHSPNSPYQPGNRHGTRENGAIRKYNRGYQSFDYLSPTSPPFGYQGEPLYPERGKRRGEKERRSPMFIEPLPILNLPEEPTVRSPKDRSPTRKGEMETSFYSPVSGLLPDRREGILHDGVTSGIAKCNSPRVSFDDSTECIGIDDVKKRENGSSNMSIRKEQNNEMNSPLDSPREPSLVKYPKKKITLKMTKKVGDFNTMVDEEDFPLETLKPPKSPMLEPETNFRVRTQKAVSMEISPTYMEVPMPDYANISVKNVKAKSIEVQSADYSKKVASIEVSPSSIQVPPADYSRRRSKIESFGAKSKQFQSIGHCEFCALHLDKVLRGDIPLNLDSRTIRARSSEIDTTDQQMRKENFYQHPQRSVGEAIYQEIYNEEPRIEPKPQNTVHTIMVGSESFRTKQYFTTYCNEYAPVYQSIDMPDLPPKFNPSRRRTIEELKNFSITIPVQIEKQLSHELRDSVYQKRNVYGATRSKSCTRDRNSGRERRTNSGSERSRKTTTLTTRDLPPGTYTSPAGNYTSQANPSADDPTALDILLLESKPSNYLWLALCTTIFFNPIFGIVALVLSMQSDSAFAKKSYEKARRLGRAVKYVSLLGMGTTVGVIIILTVELGSPQID